MNKNQYFVPEQTQAIMKDLEHTICLATIEDAEDWFVTAKNRMLDVNAWQKISTTPALAFVLTDSRGKPLNRRAHRGDHIWVESPGNGMSYEFGTIEAIVYDDYPDDDMESMAMHVRQTSVQQNESSDRDSENSVVYTLVIERRGRELSSIYHGKNEVDQIYRDGPMKESNPHHLAEMHRIGLLEGMLRDEEGYARCA